MLQTQLYQSLHQQLLGCSLQQGCQRRDTTHLSVHIPVSVLCSGQVTRGCPRSCRKPAGGSGNRRPPMGTPQLHGWESWGEATEQQTENRNFCWGTVGGRACGEGRMLDFISSLNANLVIQPGEEIGEGALSKQQFLQTFTLCVTWSQWYKLKYGYSLHTWNNTGRRSHTKFFL